MLDFIDSVARNIGTIRRIKGLIGEDSELFDNLIDNTLCRTAPATLGLYAKREYV